MMRPFSILVFDGTIRGTTEVFNSPGLNETIGRADEGVVEYEVSEASGTSPTITIKHYHSASNEDAGFKSKNTGFPSAWVSLVRTRRSDLRGEGAHG